MMNGVSGRAGVDPSGKICEFCKFNGFADETV